MARRAAFARHRGGMACRLWPRTPGMWLRKQSRGRCTVVCAQHRGWRRRPWPSGGWRPRGHAGQHQKGRTAPVIRRHPKWRDARTRGLLIYAARWLAAGRRLDEGRPRRGRSVGRPQPPPPADGIYNVAANGRWLLRLRLQPTCLPTCSLKSGWSHQPVSDADTASFARCRKRESVADEHSPLRR